jgi:hypothetical protein
MTVYGNQRGWNEFSQRIDDLIGSDKPKMTHLIDYYLKEGGRYSELKSRITEKTVELNHRGYSFTNDMLDKKGQPKDGSFLGHIATRVIDEDLAVDIGGKSIDKTFLTNLSKNQIALENMTLKELCNQDAYIRIEAFRGEKRTDPLSDNSSESIPDQMYYVPTKEDCEAAIQQLNDENVVARTGKVLDRIEENVTSKGMSLKPNWRMITKENMKNWSS